MAAAIIGSQIGAPHLAPAVNPFSLTADAVDNDAAIRVTTARAAALARIAAASATPVDDAAAAAERVARATRTLSQASFDSSLDPIFNWIGNVPKDKSKAEWAWVIVRFDSKRDIEMLLVLGQVNKAFQKRVKDILPSGFNLKEAYFIKHIPLSVIGHFGRLTAANAAAYTANKAAISAAQAERRPLKAALTTVQIDHSLGQSMVQNNNAHHRMDTPLARRLRGGPQEELARLAGEVARLELEVQAANAKITALEAIREKLFATRYAEGLEHLMRLPRHTHPRDAMELASCNWHVASSTDNLGIQRWVYIERGIRDPATTTSLRRGISLVTVTKEFGSSTITRSGFCDQRVRERFNGSPNPYNPHLLRDSMNGLSQFNTNDMANQIATDEAELLRLENERQNQAQADQEINGLKVRHDDQLEILDNLRLALESLAADDTKGEGDRTELQAKYDAIAADTETLAQSLRTKEAEHGTQPERLSAKETTEQAMTSTRKDLAAQHRAINRCERILVETLTNEGFTAEQVARDILNHPQKDDVIYQEPSCWAEFVSALQTSLLFVLGVFFLTFDYLCKATTDLIHSFIDP